MGYYVQALHPTTRTWMKARVLANRLASRPHRPQQENTPSDYDYYISFEGLDRRNDCWLPLGEVKQDYQVVTKPRKKLEKLAGYFARKHPNDNPLFGLSL
jgi:hypothetical protein